MSWFKKVRAVRGAITTENTKEDIKTDALLLYTKIVETNKIKERDIIFLQFSITSDITAYNPCTALRDAGILANTALFTSTEPEVRDSLKSVIRLLILYYGKKEPIFVYEREAKKLRGEICH